jgi:hypothetical protein
MHRKDSGLGSHRIIMLLLLKRSVPPRLEGISTLLPGDVANSRGFRRVSAVQELLFN